MALDDRLRAIPSVSSILANERVQSRSADVDAHLLSAVVRRHQDEIRSRILGGDAIDPESIVDNVCKEISLITARAVPQTVNGTGVIIHTNLGRSPVSKDTATAMHNAALNYLPLEVSMKTGERGARGEEVEALLRILTGAERSVVVNNNAAAVMLVLAATSATKEVVVSRGEAVEIGGGFRIPDVLRQSGAQIVDVGTTNRTYISDYERAIGDNTSALLRVHHSNFAMIGFTAQPDVEELAKLAHSRGILAIEDVGSGCLLDTRRYGLRYEPRLNESIKAGADVVTASGDKLLGGPQAGLIIGRDEIVSAIERHPMARAVRADKTVLAGIAATLRHYVLGEAEREIPVWWSISRSPEWLKSRVERWIENLRCNGVTVQKTESVVGGGSLPDRTLPSYGLEIKLRDMPTHEVAKFLRMGVPSVFPVIRDDAVIIDARTVLAEQDILVVSAIRNLLQSS